MSSKKLLKGAFILAFAGIVAKFLGIFFKIPLQRLIHDEGMGLFGLPYPIYTILLSVSIIGFPAAISKLISDKVAKGNYSGANKIFIVSFFLLFFLGMLISLIMIIAAPVIIKVLKWPEETYNVIIGFAFAPLFVSVMSSFRGYFQGLQLMTPTAISQIIEQIGRVFTGILLAYFFMPRGVGLAAGGAAFGATAGGLLGTIVLVLFYIKNRKIYARNNQQYFMRESTWKIIKELTWIAVPITIGAILASVMGLIDAMIVHSRLLQNGYSMEGATILYGRLTGKAVTLINVPLTFSMAMAASLVPAISESYSRQNIDEIKEKAYMGIKVTFMLALPAAMGLSVLSHQIIHLLWGSSEAGGEILKVVAINVIFISLSQTMTAILQGINRVFVPVRNLIIGVIIKWIISNILLATHLNIIGTVVGSIIGYFVIMLLNYIDIRKQINLRIKFFDTFIIPLIASVTMALIVTGVFKFLYYHFQHEGLVTLLSIMVGVIYYFTIILLTGGIQLKKGKFIV